MYVLKYGIWNVASTDGAVVKELCESGYSTLTAHVLSGRGIKNKSEANTLLRTDAPFCDPYDMKEMDMAVAAIQNALLRQSVFIFKCMLNLSA